MKKKKGNTVRGSRRGFRALLITALLVVAAAAVYFNTRISADTAQKNRIDFSFDNSHTNVSAESYYGSDQIPYLKVQATGGWPQQVELLLFNITKPANVKIERAKKYSGNYSNYDKVDYGVTKGKLWMSRDEILYLRARAKVKGGRVTFTSVPSSVVKKFSGSFITNFTLKEKTPLSILQALQILRDSYGTKPIPAYEIESMLAQFKKDGAISADVMASFQKILDSYPKPSGVAKPGLTYTQMNKIVGTSTKQSTSGSKSRSR